MARISLRKMCQLILTISVYRFAHSSGNCIPAGCRTHCLCSCSRNQSRACGRALHYHWNRSLQRLRCGSLPIHMCHLTERGLNGFLQRSGAAFQPDVQHRTNGNGTASFPLIVGAESATAIRFRVLIRFSLSSSASLTVSRRLFHDRFHAVEGRCIGKIHFGFLLFVK